MSRYAVPLALAAAIVFIGAMTWNAQATPNAGAKQIGMNALSIKDIKQAACRGNGAHCPPGYIWNGNRCAPC
jgi:hypothetical protein